MDAQGYYVCVILVIGKLFKTWDNVQHPGLNYYF